MCSVPSSETLILRRENQYLKIHNTRLKEWHAVQKDKVGKLEKENTQLKQKNKKLEDELKKLQEEIEKVRKQRDTYKGMIFKPKITPKVEKQSGKAKKLGGQPGHAGASRELPSKVDQRVRIFLKSCPHCQNPLKRSESFQTHTVEDIPQFEEVKTQVTE